jgi:putative tricarboxylic transport membrane protein
MAKHSSAARGPSQLYVEVGVAIFMALFALLFVVGSIRVGIDWGAEGPRAGFFPFYVSLFVLVASVINGVQAWRQVPEDKLFAEWGQLRQVLSVVIPAAVYVALVPVIGMYFSSMLLIGLFMKWLGRYNWALVLSVAIGVPLATFVVFERWFLVSLPKGPIEQMLGF